MGVGEEILKSELVEFIQKHATNSSFRDITFKRSIELDELILCMNTDPIPMGIKFLTNLRKLKLFDCHSLYLLNNIWDLVYLESLEISNDCRSTEQINPELRRSDIHELGRLTYIPPDIKNLKNLTNLNLSGNKLTSIPTEIEFLTKLTKLTLHNKII